MKSLHLVSSWLHDFFRRRSLWLWGAFAFWSLQTPRNWLPFHSGWVNEQHHALGRWHSTSSLVLSFLVSLSHANTGNGIPPNPLMCLDVCVCFRQAGEQWGTHHLTWQSGSCHGAEGWDGQYLGDLPFFPQHHSFSLFPHLCVFWFFWFFFNLLGE